MRALTAEEINNAAEVQQKPQYEVYEKLERLDLFQADRVASELSAAQTFMQANGVLNVKDLTRIIESQKKADDTPERQMLDTCLKSP